MANSSSGPRRKPRFAISEKGGWERDYYYFFMDRFGQAFRAELVAFFETLSRGEESSPGVTDALESLRIGVAATLSLQEGRPVKVAEVGS
jgi:myo-inositol 2-dehydrogenase / D-chiro-inositol 1-dehydrogenase